MEENKNEVEKKEETTVDNELEQKVEALEKETAETSDRLKRVMAEFENYKKRNHKEKEMQYTSILGDVVSSLLPVMDNLEKAVKAKTQDENYKQGVELVLKQFKEILGEERVKV